MWIRDRECERPGKTGCREMVKREIVAYKYDGRCKVLHNTIPNFDECVKKGATMIVRHTFQDLILHVDTGKNGYC